MDNLSQGDIPLTLRLLQENTLSTLQRYDALNALSKVKDQFSTGYFPNSVPEFCEEILQRSDLDETIKERAADVLEKTLSVS